MSLPHTLLGLLAVAPASGYALTKHLAADDGVGRHAWSAGHTSIYPELARLTDRGWIEISGEGARGKRTYSLTTEGRGELRKWLVDSPVRPSVVRNELVLRLFFLSTLDPHDAIIVLRRFIAHAESEAAELRAARSAGEFVPAGPEGFGQIAAEYGIRADEAVREWAQWAIEQFEHRVATRAHTSEDRESEQEN